VNPSGYFKVLEGTSQHCPMPVMVNKDQLISPEIIGIIVNNCSVAYDFKMTIFACKKT
jgi:TusA-related sulfurtransferase